ncbi:MAG: hypothetical protein HY817_04465 [Candidatus Abawacabacteria bacterium]|nr:hypothetical protein [Candidatus Abawacabacteria bacterium]
MKFYHHDMTNFLKRGISLSVLALSVFALIPSPTDSLTTMAAAGDWKPDTTFGPSDRGTLGFPHATGVSRSVNADVRPDNAGESTQAFRIRPSDITAGHVYTCDLSNPNNHLDEADNLHYFPDGLPYSSFNNYRNEWTNDPQNPPLQFFDSANSDAALAGEVERNYVGGKAYYPTEGVVDGTNGAKDLVTITDSTLGTDADISFQAYVHNNASTALNPTTSDPRSNLNGTNLSARATNTRMHFSIPSVAIPNSGGQAAIINRLRADNAYNLDLQNFTDPCLGFNASFNQISDLARIRNNASTPLTFVARSAFIDNPYITDSSNPNQQIEFPAAALRELVDPDLNQSHITDQNGLANLGGTQGARISSGRSSDPALRDDPNQRFLVSACAETNANMANVTCNAYAPPVLNGSEFDGEWYGSTEFVRYVGVDLDAVAATPRLSTSKSVRRIQPNEEQFTTAGPISTTIEGNSTGEVEYQVILQNTGNVDIDNISFGDLLPPEMTPVFSGPSSLAGEIAVCVDLAWAYTAQPCNVAATSIPLTASNTTIAIDSNTMRVSTAQPLARDPDYIVNGTGTNGQVVRIRWRMTTACSASNPPIAHNYGITTASSNGVQAQVVTISGFTSASDNPNIDQNDWADMFPTGASLLPQFTFATNDTQVQLNECEDQPGTPGIRIGKYVRRTSPVSTETFSTSATSTTITGNEDGLVEYAVLIENNGTEDLPHVFFADRLPPEMQLFSGTIRSEVCQNIADARAVADCPSGGLITLTDAVYNDSTRIIAFAGNEMRSPAITSDLPFAPGQVIRIRWRMRSVCTPVGTPPAVARNYALVLAAIDQSNIAPVTTFAGVTAEPGTPAGTYFVSPNQFRALFSSTVVGSFQELIPNPTNNTTVNRNSCATPPPPTVRKFVSTTPISGTNPSSFDDAQTQPGVDFGERARSTAYTVYYRVTVQNTGTTNLTDLILQDRFYLRDGTVVQPQTVQEGVGSSLETRVVNSATSETAVTPDTRKVVYLSNNSTTNILRFRVPTLTTGETLAFYYSVRVNPGAVTTSQYYRNEVEVCVPPTTTTGACVDGGRDLAFHQDRPRTETNPLVINIQKTVNGQDANEATLTGPQAAVQTVNGAALNYRVRVSTPAANNAPVTGIILTDTITTLPNVTGITNVRLTTPGAPCAVTCTLSGGIADLASRAFDLAPNQEAILTYTATARYTAGGTFNRNIARATPTPSNPRNPQFREDPATIIVRNSVITISKTVNGQEADTDDTAVTVNSGDALNYVITVRAPAGNASTVTAIVLSDNIANTTLLPNVTNIRNIRLTTPAAPCATPCTLTAISDLATRAFDLAAGQSATLTYTATANNTGTSLSASNRNTATATPATTATNPPAVNNPATVFVRGTETPDADYRITKTASPTRARDGDEVTYTIVVEPRNSSNDEINDLILEITDDINDNGTLEENGVTFTYIRNSTRIRTDDADCEGEMDDEDGIRCEDVTAEDEIRITYRVRVDLPSADRCENLTVDNTATLRSDTPGVRIRDEDDAQVEVICPERERPPEPDQPLGITKDVNRREVKRGEIVNYTIVVSNPNATDAVRTLTDTISLNAGTVPGQNGGRVRFNPGSLQVTGAYTGSIDRPEGMVITIPARGQITITYTATGEPDRNQRVVSVAPNTACLHTGECATAFVELPTTGPAGLIAIAATSMLGSATYFVATRRRKRK